jgi:REP element-mobilizing transposase RayT
MINKFDHHIPFWVRDDAIFFITVCCKKRHVNSLAKPEIVAKIKESLKYRQMLQQWWVIYALVMPDHFHAIFTFGKNFEMEQVIRNWKRYLTRFAKIEWQKDFFDHRIRSTESLDEKIEYIRQNPVRKNLVSKPEDWLYVWAGHDLN